LIGRKRAGRNSALRIRIFPVPHYSTATV
jgi:hypothetical protein